MTLFGESIVDQESLMDYNTLKKILSMPVIHPIYRISVLNPDETVSYEIPPEDIPEDGISYSEEYKNGQRRSLTLKLINEDKKYSPSVSGLWLDTKFRFDVGIKVKDRIIWFPKGIYVMGNADVSETGSSHLVTIQLSDKYSIFEGNLGTLHEGYEIEVGSNIKEVIKDLMNFSLGNGYILDYKEVLFDPSFNDSVTQSTIRIEAGGNLGAVIEALATQLSAEYYYNSVGNLCFYPINETIDDSNKPVIWVFQEGNIDLSELSLAYNNINVINVVKVVGDNISGKINYAIAENNNPKSPICIQRIGRRATDSVSDANIWNTELAQDLADYTLRQNSFVGVDFTTTVPFNPILVVNNICELENNFLGFKREKILITSISFQTPESQMSIKLCNTTELPAR